MVRPPVFHPCVQDRPPRARRTGPGAAASPRRRRGARRLPGPGV